MVAVSLKKKNFFQAEDGIRDRSPSRGLGDVYKRQMNESVMMSARNTTQHKILIEMDLRNRSIDRTGVFMSCYWRLIFKFVMLVSCDSD